MGIHGMQRLMQFSEKVFLTVGGGNVKARRPAKRLSGMLPVVLLRSGEE
jgi:hypothetical protein